MFHQKYSNANFKPKTTNVKKIKASLKKLGYVECFKRGFSPDFKIVIMIIILGIIATIIGATTALSIPNWALKGYIGVLVLVTGFVLLLKKSFEFSWKKMTALGTLASFNKGISGGGFGPVTTGGQIIAGNDHKSSIGCTTMAEAPICIAGFLTYLLTKGIANYDLAIALSIGAFVGAPFGAKLTKKLNGKKLKPMLGILIIILGAWTIIKLVM